MLSVILGAVLWHARRASTLSIRPELLDSGLASEDAVLDFHSTGTFTFWPQSAREAWTFVPDTNVTLSYTFCCNQTDRMSNVLSSIQALRFCFTDIFLLIDVPHGGKSWRGPLPGGAGGYSEVLDSIWGQQMIAAAHKIATAAVAILEMNCPMTKHHPVTWEVKILDYDNPAMRAILEDDYGIFRDGFVFSSLYANTMAYSLLWHRDTQYLWHSDADWRSYRVSDNPGPNFIDASIKLLKSDNRVIVTSPTITHFRYPPKNGLQNGFPGSVFNSTPEARREGMFQGFIVRQPPTPKWQPQIFQARWPKGETLATTYELDFGGEHFFSSQQFLMDVQKVRKLLPFNLFQLDLKWEVMMRSECTMKKLNPMIWFDESCNIIGGPGSGGEIGR